VDKGTYGADGRNDAQQAAASVQQDAKKKRRKKACSPSKHALLDFVLAFLTGSAMHSDKGNLKYYFTEF
jgi:hypothetical protein